MRLSDSNRPNLPRRDGLTGGLPGERPHPPLYGNLNPILSVPRCCGGVTAGSGTVLVRASNRWSTEHVLMTLNLIPPRAQWEPYSLDGNRTRFSTVTG